MSYDLYLRDPVTHEKLTVPGHLMTGGNIPCRMVEGQFVQIPSTEAYLNITYNYAKYYYEAFPGLEDDEEQYRKDADTFGIKSEEGGIRSLNGLSGAEAVPVLREMLRRIRKAYTDGDGDWRDTVRETHYVIDRRTGERLDAIEKINAFFDLTRAGKSEEEAGRCVDERFESVSVNETVNEGETGDYWKATAVNAMKPLHQLIALSQLRPEGIWSEES